MLGPRSSEKQRTILGLPARQFVIRLMAQNTFAGVVGLFLGLHPDVFAQLLSHPVIGPVASIPLGRILVAVLISTVLCRWWWKRRHAEQR